MYYVYGNYWIVNSVTHDLNSTWSAIPNTQETLDNITKTKKEKENKEQLFLIFVFFILSKPMIV